MAGERADLGAGRIYTADSRRTRILRPRDPDHGSARADRASDAVNVLPDLRREFGDANFRTNLDVTNTSSVTLPIEVRVIDPVTAEVYGGTRSYTVAANSLLRLGPVLALVGAPQIPGLRITVAVKETAPAFGSGGILAAAYTLDNRTQDAFAFVGQRQ